MATIWTPSQYACRAQKGHVRQTAYDHQNHGGRVRGGLAEVTSNVLRRRRWQETSRRLERAAGSKIGPKRSPRAIHKLMLCSSCVMFFSDTFPLSCKTGCRSGLDSPLRAEVVGTTCTIASFRKRKENEGQRHQVVG